MLLIGQSNYSDAIYFSIISLTKVGFGDYVPRTHPPDRYADYIHDNHKCLKGSIATDYQDPCVLGTARTGLSTEQKLQPIKALVNISPKTDRSKMGADGITMDCRKVK